jgi:hypothetical protein
LGASISASYAISTSYAVTASSYILPYIDNRSLLLCTGITPASTGSDAAEIPMPFLNDGVTPVSWSINRINLRARIPETTTSSVYIEKSIGNGSFSPITVANLILSSGSYEVSSVTAATINSNDKLRFNVDTLGSARNWTITVNLFSYRMMSYVQNKSIVLCSAYTPLISGADSVEIPIPYSSDGITPLSWSINRINMRTQTPEETTSSIYIQKSAGNGAFSSTPVAHLILSSGSYEAFTSSVDSVVSDDKIRFFVDMMGLSTGWTITVEISS